MRQDHFVRRGIFLRQRKSLGGLCHRSFGGQVRNYYPRALRHEMSIEPRQRQNS